MLILGVVAFGTRRLLCTRTVKNIECMVRGSPERRKRNHIEKSGPEPAGDR
jgi:hypothetical protein